MNAYRVVQEVPQESQEFCRVCGFHCFQTLCGVCYIQSFNVENKQLKEENRRLREENALLRRRLEMPPWQDEGAVVRFLMKMRRG